MKKGLIFIVFLISWLNIYAQFGKNKMQYQEFEWKMISSDNFDVYYNSGSKYLADYTAVTAEKALKEFERLLDYKVEGRIALIVYDSHNDFQQTNIVDSYMSEGIGGVTELYKNRVTVPFQGDYQVFHHVIRHELIHSIINYMFYGGNFRTAIKSGNIFMLPLWMNEGLAEYASIKGLNSETDMFIRDLVISQNMPPLKYLDGFLAYRGGQMFYWYIAEKYGEEKIATFLHAILNTRNLDEAFKRVFQKDFETFSNDFEKDLKKLYWSDLNRYKEPKEFSERLTDSRKDKTNYNSSPAISPDGQKMAYISAPDGLFSIFVRDIDDKKTTKRLIKSMRRQDFEDLNMVTPGISWSPDGQKIAISAKSGHEDALFIVDVKSKKYEKIPFNLKQMSSVSWSHTGENIAFIGTKKEHSDIYIYNIKSKKIENLTNDIFTERNPIFSPNDKDIYFISDRGENIDSLKTSNDLKMWKYDVYQNDIYKLNIESKLYSRITQTPQFQKTSFAISSDNSKMIYVSDENGIGNLYEMVFQTGEVRPLTNSISGITQISLSKDSGKLLYTAQTEGGYDIYMLRYPFEKKVDSLVLPLTELRKRKLKKEIAVSENIKTSTIDTTKKAYGNFTVTMDNQSLVLPNKDVKNKSFYKDNEEITNINDEFFESDYKLKFTLDNAEANPSANSFYGVTGSAQMLFSDQLGDNRIFAALSFWQDLRNSYYIVGYQYLPKLVDYTFMGYSIPSMFSSNIPISVLQKAAADGIEYDGYGLYFFKKLGLGAVASYPTSLFQRFEAGIDIINISKENAILPQYEKTEEKIVLIPSLRWVFDNTLSKGFGPFMGIRSNVELKGSPKLSNSKGLEFMSISTDTRGYIPIGQHFNFALRGSTGFSFGSDPQRYYVGGTEMMLYFDNIEYNGRGIDMSKTSSYAFMEFIMPLRGFYMTELYGKNYFVFNGEFRIPLALWSALVAGDIPLVLQNLQVAPFIDIAGAWDDDFYAYQKFNDKDVMYNLRASSGIAFRTYLMGLPIKFDIAWRREVNVWSKPSYMVSLGFDY